MLLIDHEQAIVIKSKAGFTTAVFSADGKLIVAGKDSYDQNIVVMTLDLVETNQILLSFP